MSALWSLLRRDLLLALRRPSEVLTVVFFFVVVAALFPLAIGPEAVTLRHIGPGVLWVGALLASMLTLPRLFENAWLIASLDKQTTRIRSAHLLLALLTEPDLLQLALRGSQLSGNRRQSSLMEITSSTNTPHRLVLP